MIYKTTCLVQLSQHDAMMQQQMFQQQQMQQQAMQRAALEQQMMEQQMMQECVWKFWGENIFGQLFFIISPRR